MFTLIPIHNPMVSILPKIAYGPRLLRLKQTQHIQDILKPHFTKLSIMRMNSKEVLQTKKHTFIEAHAYISSKGNNSTTLKSMNDGLYLKNPISIPPPYSIHLVQ